MELNNPRIYILVRSDLSLGQKAVQSCHALIELSNQCRLEPHPTVIVLSISSEQRLWQEMRRVLSHGLETYPFYEPDLDESLTAFAVLVRSLSEEKVFRPYQLLK